MQITTQPDGATLYRTASAQLRIKNLAPHVTHHTVAGVGTLELFEPISRDARRILESEGRCVFIVDAYDQSAIRVELREALTTFFKEQKGRDFKAAMLVQSKLVEMAASVANLLTGVSFISVYSDVRSWEAFGKQHVPGFARHPLTL